MMRLAGLLPLPLLFFIALIIVRHGASSVGLRTAAESHAIRLDNLLYPHIKGDATATLKARTHAVKDHPTYNFLHTYYRYSAEELKLYSPGFGGRVEIENESDVSLLHPRFRRRLDAESNHVFTYDMQQEKIEAEGRYGWIQLTRARELLRATSERPANLACFGLHEWAMLYKEFPKHQNQLALRVSPATINAVVEAEGSLKCTHYDGFRFFHPDAQPLNAIPLSRAVQAEHEQPACIHASMDLFKYAFKLYPLCSAHLLARTLEAALRARKIDMRASPYDVTKFEGCEEPICVETAEGRKLYVAEQTELMRLSAPLRLELLAVYDSVLSSV